MILPNWWENSLHTTLIWNRRIKTRVPFMFFAVQWAHLAQDISFPLLDMHWSACLTSWCMVMYGQNHSPTVNLTVLGLCNKQDICFESKICFIIHNCVIPSLHLKKTKYITLFLDSTAVIIFVLYRCFH